MVKTINQVYLKAEICQNYKNPPFLNLFWIVEFFILKDEKRSRQRFIVYMSVN